MQYFEPNFLDEALVLLDRFAPDTHVLAGGSILGQSLRSSGAGGTLINLKRIPELHDVDLDASRGTLHIGALVTARELAENALVLCHAPLLAFAAASLGAPQLRNVATIGGNLYSGISSADLAVALLACDARCVVAGEAAGPMTMPLAKFFETRATFDARWLLSAIEVPASRARTSYKKMQTRHAFEIALVCAAVAIECSGDRIAQARIALGGVAPMPIRARDAEARLEDHRASVQVARAAAQTAAQYDAAPETDHRASADYRRQLVRVLVERALLEAFETRARPAR